MKYFLVYLLTLFGGVDSAMMGVNNKNDIVNFYAGDSELPFSLDLRSAGVSVYEELVDDNHHSVSLNALQHFDQRLEVYLNDSHWANIHTSESDIELSPDFTELFKRWCRKYGFTFSDEEYSQRYEAFRRNTYKIINHNRRESQYRLGHNKFSALRPSEFSGNYKGLKYNDSCRTRKYQNLSNIIIPRSLDWRLQGVVTRVKNQGQCGSCWAFSTIGALEGAYSLKTGVLRNFSEEQLVDCDSNDGGCGGGLMDNAFQWIGTNGGICNLTSYPYVSGGGTSPTCYDNCTLIPNTNVTNYYDVVQTEEGLMRAVAKQPLAVAIEADQSSFQSYRGGVITGDCGSQLDHGVLLVGYGHDWERNVDYWLIKNSWGEDWGENGYVRIQRGKDVSGGQCGIQLSASYPVL